MGVGKILLAMGEQIKNAKSNGDELRKTYFRAVHKEAWEKRCKGRDTRETNPLLA